MTNQAKYLDNIPSVVRQEDEKILGTPKNLIKDRVIYLPCQLLLALTELSLCLRTGSIRIHRRLVSKRKFIKQPLCGLRNAIKYMSSLSDSHRNSSIKHPFIKGMASPAILKLQGNFRLNPRKICLISGAPRSRTSALCEWLGHQQGLSAFAESRILVSIHMFMSEVILRKVGQEASIA
jgi:hypothetical protein